MAETVKIVLVYKKVKTVYNCTSIALGVSFVDKSLSRGIYDHGYILQKGKKVYER